MSSTQCTLSVRWVENELRLGNKSNSQGSLEWMPRRMGGNGLRKLPRGAHYCSDCMTGLGWSSVRVQTRSRGTHSKVTDEKKTLHQTLWFKKCECLHTHVCRRRCGKGIFKVSLLQTCESGYWPKESWNWTNPYHSVPVVRESSFSVRNKSG